jgi:hypothetical protein
MLPEIRSTEKLQNNAMYLVYSGVGRYRDNPGGRTIWNGHTEVGVTVRGMMERYGEHIAVFGPLPSFIADIAKPCNCEDEKPAIGVVTPGPPPAQPGDESPPEDDRRFQAAFERAVTRHVSPEKTPAGKPNPMMLVFPWHNYGGFASEGFLVRQSEIGNLDPGTYFAVDLRQFMVPNPNLRLVG